jgi:hypothetical protein
MNVISFSNSKLSFLIYSSDWMEDCISLSYSCTYSANIFLKFPIRGSISDCKSFTRSPIIPFIWFNPSYNTSLSYLYIAVNSFIFSMYRELVYAESMHVRVLTGRKVSRFVKTSFYFIINLLHNQSKTQHSLENESVSWITLVRGSMNSGDNYATVGCLNTSVSSYLKVSFSVSIILI